MKPIMRRYQHAEDYWRIRQFLRDVHLLNNREQVSWEVARFDYWRWHGILNMKDGTLEDDVFLWETNDGQLTAVLNREAPGSVFLQIHPDFRNEQQMAEMLTVAEEHLSIPTQNGRRVLHVWAERKDASFRDTLQVRGYCMPSSRSSEYQRRRSLFGPITGCPVAEGYTIRPLGDVDEHLARCRLSWQTFHPGDSNEHIDDDWYGNIQRAPLYRRDLDLVAVAPDGQLAAFCTIWFDDVTRTGLFEPVGTAPQHRKQGLGKAILTEGLARLQRIGADIAFVGSYSEAAHALYASVGFECYRILDPWSREIA